MAILTAAELFALVQRHGASPGLDRVMVASALTESGGNTMAMGDGGRSRGLWQINDIHRLRAEDRHDPDYAASWMLENMFRPAAAEAERRGYQGEDLAAAIHMAAEKPVGWGGWGNPGIWSPAALRFRANWRSLEGLPGGGQEDTPMDWSPLDCRDSFPFEGCELDARPLSHIREVIYHHGASAMPAPTVDAELALLQAYHRLHVSNGWCVLSYHLAVGPSGNAYYCNNIGLTTYHATTANPTSVGIVFLGNYATEPPSQIMLDAAVRARLWVAEQCGQADLPYRGHKDVAGGTACPGAWWPEPGQDLLANIPESIPEPAPEEPEDMPSSDAQRIAELESQLGYLTGDLAAVLERDASAVAVAPTLKQAREIATHGLLPAIETLKRGGA